MNNSLKTSSNKQTTPKLTSPIVESCRHRDQLTTLVPRPGQTCQIALHHHTLLPQHRSQLLTQPHNQIVSYMTYLHKEPITVQLLNSTDIGQYLCPWVGAIFFHVCQGACVCIEQNCLFHASISKRLMPLQVSRVLSSGLNNDLLQRVWLCGSKVQNANRDFDYSNFGNFPNWPTNFK